MAMQRGEERRDPDQAPCPLFSELFSCSARRVQIKPVHGRYGCIKSTSRYNDPKGAFLKGGGTQGGRTEKFDPQKCTQFSHYLFGVSAPRFRPGLIS